MSHTSRGYLAATCHPWACVLFLWPLLAAYEAGVFLIGGGHPEALRNGADTWLRWALQSVGLSDLYCAPLLLMSILLVWSWRRRADRPQEHVAVWIGMMVESALFAGGLWGISRGLAPLLTGLGIPLEVPTAGPDPALEQIVSFVGAGIYEETLFRLFLLLGSGSRSSGSLEVPWAGVLAGTDLLLPALCRRPQYRAPRGSLCRLRLFVPHPGRAVLRAAVPAARFWHRGRSTRRLRRAGWRAGADVSLRGLIPPRPAD